MTHFQVARSLKRVQKLVDELHTLKATVRRELAAIRFSCPIEEREVKVPDTWVRRHKRCAHVKYMWLPKKAA